MKKLNAKLRQSGYLSEVQDDLDLAAPKDELKQKFLKIDYENARLDVVPFIRDSQETAQLDFWSTDLFIGTLDYLREDAGR